MDAQGLKPAETIPASRKLGEADARALLAAAGSLVVAKGRGPAERLTVPKSPGADLVARMLGPTGNLRAPTARVGRTLLVGFNEDAWQELLS